MNKEERIGAYSLADVRRDFPLIQTYSQAEPPLVYLDNAATSQKPQQVIDRLVRYYTTENANVHRAIHSLGESATRAYEQSRTLVKEFIRAKEDKEIIFTHGATESINLVAYAWARHHLSPGDTILLSTMEHHSNLIPWQILSQELGCRLAFLPIQEDGSLDMLNIENFWPDGTKLLAITQMSNVLGTINDVKKLISLAHSRHTPVLIDAAQSVPHLPVNVQELDCDFLAFSGHKMYGPTGIGVLYAKEAFLEQMEPFMGGGEMILAVWLERATWNDPPYKFEAGTPNIAAAVALSEAVAYLNRLGLENIRLYEERLTRFALTVLSELDFLTIYGHAPQRGGVISFNIQGIHPHDVAQFLDKEGIAVRAGHHCAHPLMRELNVPATVRASLCFYNSADEILALKKALIKTKEFFL